MQSRSSAAAESNRSTRKSESPCCAAHAAGLHPHHRHKRHLCFPDPLHHAVAQPSRNTIIRRRFRRRRNANVSPCGKGRESVSLLLPAPPPQVFLQRHRSDALAATMDDHILGHLRGACHAPCMRRASLVRLLHDTQVSILGLVALGVLHEGLATWRSILMTRMTSSSPGSSSGRLSSEGGGVRQVKLSRVAEGLISHSCLLEGVHARPSRPLTSSSWACSTLQTSSPGK